MDKAPHGNSKGSLCAERTCQSSLREEQAPYSVRGGDVSLQLEGTAPQLMLQQPSIWESQHVTGAPGHRVYFKLPRRCKVLQHHHKGKHHNFGIRNKHQNYHV